DYQKAIINIEQHLLNFSDRVICCSSYIAGHIRHSFDLPAYKIDAIPNGVDILPFNPGISIRKRTMENLRRRFAMMAEGRSPNSKMILFVGRLVQEKGVHILINAFEKLLHDKKYNSSYSISLIIVGEGPLKQTFKR